MQFHFPLSVFQTLVNFSNPNLLKKLIDKYFKFHYSFLMNCPSNIDYSSIDWSKTNTEIGKKLGYSSVAISRLRIEFGTPLESKWGKKDLDLDYEYKMKKGYGGGDAWINGVKKRWGTKCVVCGYCKPPVTNHTHHIIPTSLGGKNTIRNGIVLCSRCHDEVHANLLDLSPFLKDN